MQSSSIMDLFANQKGKAYILALLLGKKESIFIRIQLTTHCLPPQITRYSFTAHDVGLGRLD